MSHDQTQMSDRQPVMINIINFFHQRAIKWTLLPCAGKTNPFSDPIVEKKLIKNYGYGSRGCNNSDKKDACWRCGTTGLLAKNCKATPWCLACSDRDDKDVAHVFENSAWYQNALRRAGILVCSPNLSVVDFLESDAGFVWVELTSPTTILSRSSRPRSSFFRKASVRLLGSASQGVTSIVRRPSGARPAQIGGES